MVKRYTNIRLDMLATLLAAVFCLGVYTIDGQAQARTSQTNRAGSATFLSQNNGYLGKVISMDIQNKTRLEAVQEIAAKAGLNVTYNPALKALYQTVSLTYTEITVQEALWKALEGAHIRFAASKNGQLALFPYVNLEQQEVLQTGTVTGFVTDAETGETLPGASVFIKGSSKGVATNTEGVYTLQLGPGDYTLAASFIGYQRGEQPVEARAGEVTTVDFALEHAVSTYGEVVVNAGYYDVNRAEMTGNIARVSAADIEKQPVTNLLGALHGRMPGVSIQQTSGIPGSDFKIEIRGRNSLRRDGNDPLYIVDGVPFSSEKVSSTYNTTGIIAGGGVSPLASINSADIESIEVLKDADATAIYGSRGANGVVLITTKKGKAGDTKVDLNFYSGVGQVHRKELLSTEQYLDIRREAFANDGLIPTANPEDDGSNGLAYAPDLMVWDATRYTDWQEEFIGGSAHTTSLQTSVSGGNAQTQFLLSGGYYGQTTVFPGDFTYRKLSSHLSLNHSSPDDKFTVSLSLSGSWDLNNQPSSDFTGSSRRLAPNAPALYHADGSLNWAYHPETGQATWGNPMSRFERTYDGKVTNLNSSIMAGYELLPGVRLQTRAGFSLMDSNERTTYPSTQYDPALGYGSERSGVNTSSGGTGSWIIEPQLHWEQDLAEGQLSMLAGGSYQQQHHEVISQGHGNFPSNTLLNDVSAASIHTIYGYTTSIYKYAAVFGRLNYNWRKKYILNLTGRRDGSSRFGPGRQFANFGAAGAAWIFSREEFIQNALPFLSFGKLRASYGVTGSDRIGDYQYLDNYGTISSGSSAQEYDGVTGLEPASLFNPDYGWETNRKLEGALELGVWEDRVSLSLSWYRNRSSNQLVNYTLPRTTGFSGVLANLGATVQNSGWEAELTTVNMRSKSINWTTSVNLTIPRNKLLSFPDIESSTYANTYIVGESIYIRKFYEYTGVDPQTGLFTFRDVNGDGVLSEPADNTIARFVGTDFFGGINNSLAYKNWTLDVFFQLVKQDGIATSTTAIPGYINQNFPSELLGGDRWRAPGDQASQPRYATEYTVGFGASIFSSPWQRYHESDGVVTDASFLRLKTLSLSYHLPAAWLGGRSGRVYLQGHNLFVFTGYKGYDPETQSQHVLPPLRTITLGINLNL